MKQYEFIDLGLPSGLKWAKCNVGAEKETDYGSYFQWGDIEDKTNSDCRWESYKHCNGSYKKLTKYCVDNEYGPFGTVDDKTSLDIKDDAAAQIMGGVWRMPTKGDFQELLDNTNSEWVTINGINGRKFTSKTNGNSIFIPASGSRLGSSFYGQGIGGYVWSSSLDTEDNGCAWDLHFDSDNISSIYYNFYRNRYRGYVVRGVMD